MFAKCWLIFASGDYWRIVVKFHCTYVPTKITNTLMKICQLNQNQFLKKYQALIRIFIFTFHSSNTVKVFTQPSLKMFVRSYTIDFNKSLTQNYIPTNTLTQNSGSVPEKHLFSYDFHICFIMETYKTHTVPI